MHRHGSVTTPRRRNVLTFVRKSPADSEKSSSRTLRGLKVMFLTKQLLTPRVSDSALKKKKKTRKKKQKKVKTKGWRRGLKEKQEGAEGGGKEGREGGGEIVC